MRCRDGRASPSTQAQTISAGATAAFSLLSSPTTRKTALQAMLLRATAAYTARHVARCTGMPEEVDGVKPRRRVELPIDCVGCDRERAVYESAEIGRPVWGGERAPNSIHRLNNRIPDHDGHVVHRKLIPDRGDVDRDGASCDGEIDAFVAGEHGVPR